MGKEWCFSSLTVSVSTSTVRFNWLSRRKHSDALLLYDIHYCDLLSRFVVIKSLNCSNPSVPLPHISRHKWNHRRGLRKRSKMTREREMKRRKRRSTRRNPRGIYHLPSSLLSFLSDTFDLLQWLILSHSSRRDRIRPSPFTSLSILGEGPEKIIGYSNRYSVSIRPFTTMRRLPLLLLVIDILPLLHRLTKRDQERDSVEREDLRVRTNWLRICRRFENCIVKGRIAEYVELSSSRESEGGKRPAPYAIKVRTKIRFLRIRFIPVSSLKLHVYSGEPVRSRDSLSFFHSFIYRCSSPGIPSQGDRQGNTHLSSSIASSAVVDSLIAFSNWTFRPARIPLSIRLLER